MENLIHDSLFTHFLAKHRLSSESLDSSWCEFPGANYDKTS